MPRLFTALGRLIRGQRGATLVEYGLLLGLIGAVVLVAMTALGHWLSSVLTAAAHTI
jgi:Flp pilus assembly pilin Flp